MTPPPQFASYPRGLSGPEAADRVQALFDGYRGLNMVFIVNLIGSLALNGYLRELGNSNASITVAGIGFLVMGVTVMLLTLPHNRKIGIGAGWDSSRPIIASVLMGLNSALCCGIIGYIVMQTIANNHLKSYGITSGAFGPKKDVVEARVAELRAMGQPMGMPPT